MTAIQETTVLALSPVASFQSLGDSAVILMTDSGQLYTCNQTTESFLKKIDGLRSLTLPATRSGTTFSRLPPNFSLRES
jgi:hypothetical protein